MLKAETGPALHCFRPQNLTDVCYISQEYLRTDIKKKRDFESIYREHLTNVSEIVH